MGMFDGILGGVVGAEMATVVNSLIQKHGGLQGIVAQLEQQGLGGTARSWVAEGARVWVGSSNDAGSMTNRLTISPS